MSELPTPRGCIWLTRVKRFYTKTVKGAGGEVVMLPDAPALVKTSEIRRVEASSPYAENVTSVWVRGPQAYLQVKESPAEVARRMCESQAAPALQTPDPQPLEDKRWVVTCSDNGVEHQSHILAKTEEQAVQAAWYRGVSILSVVLYDENLHGDWRPGRPKISPK